MTCAEERVLAVSVASALIDDDVFGGKEKRERGRCSLRPLSLFVYCHVARHGWKGKQAADPRCQLQG